MIEYRNLSDKDNLIETIMRFDAHKVSRETVELIVDKFIEICVEIWIDGILGGYVMITNFNGQRSLDGYKLIDGYALTSFRIANRMHKLYPDAIIAHTDEKGQVNRLAQMLGFKETLKIDNCIKMEAV